MLVETSEMSMAEDSLDIVLIEDDDIDAESLIRLIKKLGLGGVGIDHFATMESFENSHRSRPPVAVITDLSLPDADGIEAVERAIQMSNEAPVIVLTGNTNPKMIEGALAKGAQDYLVKGSFDIDALGRSLRYSMIRARGESELRETTRALTRSNAELDSFAGIVAHDLRAPARTARLLADRLVANRDSPDLADDLAARLDSCLGRLEDLISGVLDSVALNDEQVCRQPFHLDYLVSCVAEVLHADLNAVGADLTCSRTAGLNADLHLVQRLITNLVENSLKYRAPDRPCRISIEGEQIGSSTRIRVIDNGIGIAAEYREKVFELFERLHTHSEIEGLGLGLAMCSKIVAMHDGTISIADPEDGVGTVVEITLPRSVARTKPLQTIWSNH